MSFGTLNHRFTQLKKAIVASILCSSFFLSTTQRCIATPMYNIQDPAIIHTIYGTDKFYDMRQKSSLSLHISPYFIHTVSASKAGGGKVPAGNILGRWNMYALFFNQNAPSNTTLTKFNAAKSAISGLKPKTGGKDLTMETMFDPDEALDRTGSYKEVALLYEKTGLRGQLSFDFGFGIGVVVKGGVADYKHLPEFHLDDGLQNSIKPSAEGGGTAVIPDIETAKKINDILLATKARKDIAQELGLDINEQHKTDLEDLHVSVRWNMPIKIREKGEHIFTLIPHLSVGAWLPLAQEKDQNKAFSTSTGNDGFSALTTEGAITMDFPKQMQLSVGGGAALFNTRELKSYRVPTSEFQVGIIPWQTTITKEPGPLWYANVSFKADHFIPDFSFYFDYIYTEHTKDTIIVKEPVKERRDKFKPEQLVKESAWKTQNMNAGIKYDLSSYCALGFAVQGTISGSRTYRPTTVLGSIVITF